MLRKLRMECVEHVSRNLGFGYFPRQDMRDLDAPNNRCVNKVF